MHTAIEIFCCLRHNQTCGEGKDGLRRDRRYSWQFVCVKGAVLLISWILFVGCETGVPTEAKEALARLPQAQSIRIQNDWTGLSPAAPLEAHYTLQRTAAGFSGKASFAAGGYGGHPRRALREIEIPSEAAHTFLQMLSEAPIRAGRYEPTITHTDDYPSIRIELETETERVVFFSESQGAGHVPWGVTLKGKTYVSRSDVPARALATLSPYLEREALERLEAEVEAEA